MTTFIVVVLALLILAGIVQGAAKPQSRATRGRERSGTAG